MRISEQLFKRLLLPLSCSHRWGVSERYNKEDGKKSSQTPQGVLETQ